MKNAFSGTMEDPLSWIGRIASKLRSLWVSWTYPFPSIGNRFSLHYSCEISRKAARYISVGRHVTMGRDAWLNVPEDSDASSPTLVVSDGCIIGRRCVISAKNSVELGRDVIFGPSVLVMDHNHAFEDVTVPIALQGVTTGGTIRIEDGCWLGFGAAIVCGKGELVIGKQSVIGANSVVTRSVPPYSVVTGNPARVVKQFDPETNTWVLGNRSASAQRA